MAIEGSLTRDGERRERLVAEILQRLRAAVVAADHLAVDVVPVRSEIHASDFPARRAHVHNVERRS